jgi:bacterioferritin
MANEKKTAKKVAPAPTAAIVGILNDLRARELAVVTQYMRHHYIITGAAGLALEDEFKEVAVTEMKHAEALAERIDFLGGDPTTKPAAIRTGDTDLASMATADLAAEDEAVILYRDAIETVMGLGDVTTRRLLEDILGDEESHVNTFRRMLGR